MPVYLIRCGANGPVKIGKANDPQLRRNDLQTAHWENLTILRLWDGDEAEEAVLHLRFADLRIRGDWFFFSRQMLAPIEGLTESTTSSKADVPSTNDIKQIEAPLTSGEIIRALGGATALSKAISAQRSAISNWVKDGIPPKFWLPLSRMAADIEGAQHITLETLEKHVAGRNVEEAA